MELLQAGLLYFDLIISQLGMEDFDHNIFQRNFSYYRDFYVERFAQLKKVENLQSFYIVIKINH